MDDSLPEVLQGEWSEDQVLQLFSDLAAGAEVEHVQLRAVENDAIVTLQQAREAFARGTARAIQVRYRFEQQLWCDTIIPGEPTTRIIRSRMQH